MNTDLIEQFTASLTDEQKSQLREIITGVDIGDTQTHTMILVMLLTGSMPK